MPTGSEASAPPAKTDFPISPLENSKTTPPSASTKKGNNTLSFKPNLTIPWDKAPAGSDIYKADKNADYLRVNKPTVAQPVFDQDFEKTFKTLPAVTQVAINKDKELKSEFFNFYKNNPKDIEKFKAWDSKTSLNEATSQSIRQEILQKFYNGVINKYIPRLEELEKSGVGSQLQKAKGFYEDYNKSIDDLKKAKVKLDFYQNNFIESKGYGDVVNEGKQLNGKLKDFNIDAWKADNEKISNNLGAAKANVEQYVVNGSVPREYQDRYAEAYAQYEYAVNVYNEHNNIPELKEYNQNIQSLNSLKSESDNILKEFDNNPNYKKAKEDYNASLQRVQSMNGQAEEFKKQQPLFSEYIQKAKRVSDLVGKVELANKGFPIPISREETRQRITKLYDDGYMNESTLRNWSGVLESIPKAVNSVISGAGSALSALTPKQAGNYNIWDKASDYYNGLNKYNTTILPTMEAYKKLKDGSTKWDIPAIGFKGLQQVGNMAVFVALGAEKSAMVATGYMMSRKDREDEADEAGLKGLQKEAYVSTLSTLEGLSELIMPDNQIFTKELKNLLLKDAILAQTKGINWFRKQAFKRITENTSKEIAEEWTVSFGELMQKAAINYSNGNVFDISKYKDINSWIETAAVTAPLTILASSRSEINRPKMELNIARFQAARNLTKSREILDDLVSTGNMTNKKADEEYKKIANFAVVQSVMPQDISPEKAVQIAPFIIENEQLRIQIESGVDAVFKKQIEERIKGNIAKAEEILIKPEKAISITDEQIENAVSESPENLNSEENLSRVTEEQEKFDEQIRAFQERTNYKPEELKIEGQVKNTIDRLSSGAPVDIVAVEEASNALYAKYKQYENMLDATSRYMTTDQIKGLMSELEGYITKLENVKNGKDFNAEVATGTAPLESTADTVVEAPKAYQESISSRDIEQGFGEDTVEGFLDSQYYTDIIASAKAEGLTAAQVIKDLYKQNAFDNLETREDIDAIEVQLKRDLAANAAPVTTAEQVEPIDEFVEANYTQIVADLKLANKIKTKGCAY